MSQTRQIFFDAAGARWKYLLRTFSALGMLGVTLLVVFIIRIGRAVTLPDFLPPVAKQHSYTPVAPSPAATSTSKQMEVPSLPSEGPANLSAPMRAAFYKSWDAASYSSLKQYVDQLDMLVPEWLHVYTADGRLQGIDAEDHFFDVIQPGGVKAVDDKVMPLLTQQQRSIDVLPMVTNFDPLKRQWVSDIAQFLNDPEARGRFRRELLAFVHAGNYAGLTLGLDELPASANAGYRDLVAELSGDLHANGYKLYVTAPVDKDDYDFPFVAAHSDRIILMNFDEHFPGGMPGPVASADWFANNLKAVLAKVPAAKLIVGIGNYGYSWSVEDQDDPQAVNQADAQSVSAQQAWYLAQQSGATIEFDRHFLNPHFAFVDEEQIRHEVWFTDAITALNQMRTAQRFGINSFTLFCLGAEDRSLWSVWKHPEAENAALKLNHVPPGPEIEREGSGEVLSIGVRPSAGQRKVLADSAGQIVGEQFQRLPLPYVLNLYGTAAKKVALTFDDGPDPQWTPQILDVLKQEHAPAAFFMIGSQAANAPTLVSRIYADGHEIGNHSWSHPDISRISQEHVAIELNLTERFFAAQLGVKPVMFRPPYSVTQNPETAEELQPMNVADDLGYVSVANYIDPDDWRTAPGRTAQQVADEAIAQLGNGNILLLHDGGGDRSLTVRALPQIIHELRARGYQIVPVSELLGKSRAEIMPAASKSDRWLMLVDLFDFRAYHVIRTGISWFFLIGTLLMSARLLFVGSLAVVNRMRSGRKALESCDFNPPVAVLVPAYNEEKVVVSTVRSVLNSDYANLRVIVIDDGSKDATYAVARETFAGDPRVTVLTKANGGKAAALNFALEQITEEIYIGIDADTQIDPKAISSLVPHLASQDVAAVAGNAKVGNRVNLWTRWQALEYITSQNFERRALDVFGAVTVVPGAIGAWRTAAVREAGGYPSDTVAEDADLTMALLERGYRVHHEDRAYAYTEAPTVVSGLMKQRLRWSFGIMQAVWKHRAAFTRKDALGLFALPNLVIFHILLPVLSPLIDVAWLLGLASYLLEIKLKVHPDGASFGGLTNLLTMFTAFMTVDLAVSVLAVALEYKRGDGPADMWLLFHVWLQRFSYRQVLSLVIVKTLKRAAEGRPLGWGKLERTATVCAPLAPAPATGEIAVPARSFA